ncbi:hypothetical protein [Emticicia sp. SJ17W-69]|uniref:hypothetical protein n=1 Tax=Emticicia sp. SJ17W-69 TaxID=3421657 RepID=UPI003EBBD8DC
MKMTVEQFILIEAYLEDKLSEADSLDFENEMNHNSELADEVKLQKELRFGLKMLSIENQLDVALKRHKSKYFEEESVKTGKFVQMPVINQNRYSKIKIWSIAASILLILSVTIFFLKFNITNSQQAFEENYRPNLDDGFQVKSIPFELKSNTKNGIDSYHDGKYDEALHYLEQVNSKNSDELAIKNYYLGVSFLAKNDANSAIRALLKSKICTLKIIRDNSDWYLALAYLKKNDRSKMKIAFETMASNPNHPYNLKAKSLLKLLF